MSSSSSTLASSFLASAAYLLSPDGAETVATYDPLAPLPASKSSIFLPYKVLAIILAQWFSTLFPNSLLIYLKQR